MSRNNDPLKSVRYLLFWNGVRTGWTTPKPSRSHLVQRDPSSASTGE